MTVWTAAQERRRGIARVVASAAMLVAIHVEPDVAGVLFWTSRVPVTCGAS